MTKITTNIEQIVQTIAESAARASVEASVHALPEILAAMNDGKAKPTKKRQPTTSKPTKKRQPTATKPKAKPTLAKKREGAWAMITRKGKRDLTPAMLLNRAAMQADRKAVAKWKKGVAELTEIVKASDVGHDPAHADETLALIADVMGVKA